MVYSRTRLLLLLAVLGEGAQEHSMVVKRSECTSGLPPALSAIGVANICADMELIPCSDKVRVGLRFANADHAMVTEEIKTGDTSACASATEFGRSSLDQACGTEWSICLSFSALQIGHNHLAGCPSVQVAHPPVVGSQICCRSASLRDAVWMQLPASSYPPASAAAAAG